jgi:hypothetical protein
MVLAESVQIDGGEVALILGILAMILASYLVLLLYGARVVRRAVQADASPGQMAGVVVVAVLDLILVVTALSNGRASGGSPSLFLMAPAVVHGFVWLMNRPSSGS